MSPELAHLLLLVAHNDNARGLRNDGGMSALTDVHCLVSVFFLVVLVPFVVFLVQV